MIKNTTRAHPDPDKYRTHLSAAAYEGRTAAEQGRPITACPYTSEKELAMAAEWRNAWAAERDRRRNRTTAQIESENYRAMAKYNRENQRSGGIKLTWNLES